MHGVRRFDSCVDLRVALAAPRNDSTALRVANDADGLKLSCRSRDVVAITRNGLPPAIPVDPSAAYIDLRHVPCFTIDCEQTQDRDDV
jgi:exoribonuclease R